jgi:hypothetical protein
MSWVGWIAAGAALVATEAVCFGIVLRREGERTLGLGYFGLPRAARAAYRRRLRLQARILWPFLRLLSLGRKLSFRQATFQFRGVGAPWGNCSPASFERGAAFVPAAGDVIVATQMKCGTTWMQHLVYQILLRGRGNLVETGTALYAVSPWLEGLRSVPLEQAPRIGAERPARIIKTHFPASLCRWTPDAKYLYVVRHPVSCFASCVDFVAGNVGGLTPPMAAFEEWFRSKDLMWWGTWPDHVKGWWARAHEHPNVLVSFFEEMKTDLPAVIRRVAEFLGVAPLTADELARVAERCSFEYMRDHQEAFEMHPPQLLQADAAMFVKGSADRYRDVPPEVRDRLAAWVVAEMASSDFPLGLHYPELAVRPDGR